MPHNTRAKPKDSKVIKQWLFSFADNQNPDSLASRMRRERVGWFQGMMRSLPKPTRILDVGGTQEFWETMGFAGQEEYQITLVNLGAEQTQYDNISSIQGDARHLKELEDNAFDVVFSNSVIEHVGTFGDQKRMAEEVMRLAPCYFIQTPNRYFPIEPHFLFPFFQFLPIPLKIVLIRHFALGWFPKTPDATEARVIAEEIRLMNEGELRALFPGGQIKKEKLLWLTKSLVIHAGFDG